MILYAQSIKPTDSTLIYYKLSRTQFENGKLDSSHFYAKKSYDLAKKHKRDSMLTMVVTTLSYVEPDLNKALTYLEEAAIIAKKNKNWSRLANIYHVKGSKYGHNNNDDKALLTFLKLDSLFSKRKCNAFLEAMNKVNIINVLETSRSLNDTTVFPQIDRLIKEGLLIKDVVPSDVPFAILLQHKAELYKVRKQKDKALFYYNEALKRTVKKSNYLRQALIYKDMAEFYEMNLQNDSALVYYKKQLRVINKTVDTMQMAVSNYKAAAFYAKTKKPFLALEHIKKSKELFLIGEYMRDEDDYRINTIASQAYYELGNFEEAYKASKKANRLLEIIQTDNNNENVVELETKYQTEKKEQEIKLLTSENELIEKQKKNQQLILLSTITISTLAALFLFFLFKSRRKVNTKLRELDATKSRFFANISHEFRTPLTLISNPIDEAIEDNSLPEGKREQFKVAKRNSDRLLTLVNQLLDLSKIDANQLKLNIEKAELIPFIAALADSFSYSAEQKEVSYLVNAERNSTEVYFDKDAIEKIVTNLIANAIKYTPSKEEIKLSCSIVDDQLLFEVKNSGSQLTQKEAKVVFNRFYQTNEDNSGSGIGLALAKELVDLHKGNIAVNITEDNWISFSVKLPVDYNSYKNETFTTSTLKENSSKVEIYNDITDEQEADVAINDNKPILLIVEDHADIRNLVKNLFSDTYSVLTATNGEEGVNLAIEHVPDIIISDIMMPIKDGIVLTQHLKNDERTSHIPIVLLTAKAGDNNELLGIEVGADDYITKPFNSKILTTKVEKLIANRRLLQERYSQELVLLPKDVAITNIDEQFLERLQNVLDTNLVEPTFSASSFSEAIGMSRMQLHRKLKALTGLTTSEFIRSQRLKLAAELLKQSNTNVSQIGYSVGFNDHAYFSKCFKELYNCTPTEYANKA
ncbi:two-component system sensor histidine kinase/response regulator, hybrid ('one-component system') [Flavobacteriales bacterium ALC-1]|nr:two-component system sensor histidine kinase/response regulator, hybrid ('one-component system') [Flavobacteriales bacterium ALC-1]